MTEHQEQAAFFQWLRLVHPELAEMATAVPNGGHRHISVAKKLKAEGVSPGYPDILIDYPQGPYHGLRIEMKAPRGPRGGVRNGPTLEQNAWLCRLRVRGYAAKEAYGCDEAILLVKRYLELGK